jgi:hypothetical protein
VQVETAIARQQLAGLAAMLPHSPAREGPLAFTPDWRFITGNLPGAIASLVTTMEGGLGRFVTAFSATAGRAGDQARAIGTDIAGGVETGFRDAAGGLGGAALAMIRSLLATTRRALEIRSPSGLAAREIGEPIGEGIGAGAARGLSSLADVLGDVVRLVQEASR